MGGGFKFPKESLKHRVDLTSNIDQNYLNDSDGLDETIILQDQVMNDLNLLSGAHLGADIKGGSLTKAAITKDLTENITKEIEKLRRQSDNIMTRKQLIVEGSIDEITPEERAYEIKLGLEEKGCTVIHAEEERVQAMRHQTGQLGGLGAITMEEVVRMKEITAQRIKELEIEYYKNRDTRFLSSEVRKRLKTYDENYDEEAEREEKLREKNAEYDALERKAKAIKENKKFLESPYNPTRTWVRRIYSKGEGEEVEVDQSQQLLASAKKEEEPISSISPRSQVYLAKFSKYKINKKLYNEYEKAKPTRKDFDLVLKGKDSKNKLSKSIHWDDLFKQKLRPKKFSKDFDVYQEDYDLTVFESIKNKLERMSKEDKVTFSILKWVFNAIKNKKDNTITKKELSEQLDQNVDIIKSLGFANSDEVYHQLSSLKTKQSGKLNWEEFLDFFWSKSNSYKQAGLEWWKTEVEGREYFIPIDEPVLAKMDPKERKKQYLSQAYDKMNTKADGQQVFVEVEKTTKAGSAMQKLSAARVDKHVIQEMESELKDLK